MDAFEEQREREETASRDLDRWLAVSDPLPIDDDPSWEASLSDTA
jgi:hypothetical protein